MRFRNCQRKMAKLFANSGDPDQTLHSEASDQGLHCLQITLSGVFRLQWVSRNTSLRRMNTLSGETTKTFTSLLKNGSTLKEERADSF